MIVSIASRFCGPVNSGNGGYTAGLIADALAGNDMAGKGHAWSIRLRQPPPLNEPLQLSPGEGGAFSMRRVADDDASVIAEATWQVFPMTTLRPPVDFERARAGERDSIAWSTSRFGSCFVCGSQRAPGDGLRIFPGPVGVAPRTADGQTVATLWRPDVSLAEDGRIAARYVWSALDCPGYFAINEDREYLLLAQMSARIYELPAPDKPLLIQAWPLGRERRSKMAATAIYAGDGRILAVAHTRWMPPRGVSVPPPGADQQRDTQKT